MRRLDRWAPVTSSGRLNSKATVTHASILAPPIYAGRNTAPSNAFLAVATSSGLVVRSVMIGRRPHSSLNAHRAPQHYAAWSSNNPRHTHESWKNIRGKRNRVHRKTRAVREERHSHSLLCGGLADRPTLQYEAREQRRDEHVDDKRLEKTAPLRSR